MARFEAAERALYRGPLSSLLGECSRGGVTRVARHGLGPVWRKSSLVVGRLPSAVRQS